MVIREMYIGVLTLLMLGLPWIGCAQTTDSAQAESSEEVVLDDLVLDPDTDTTIVNYNTHPYWEKGHYDAVPYVPHIHKVQPHEFDTAFAHYQTDDFLYIEKISDKIGFWDRLKRRVNNFLNSLFPDFYFRNPDWFYKVLGAVGALLLVLIIYRLIFTGRKVYIKHTEEHEDMTGVEFVERNLLRVDVKTFIDQALRDEDYALAIRYQNLLNIQLLANKGLIEWSHTKSSIELMAAMENVELRRDFELCSNLFNHVWFGSFPISKAEYEKYTVLFSEFQMKWA